MKKFFIIFVMMLMISPENNCAYSMEEKGSQIYSDYVQSAEDFGYDSGKDFSLNELADYISGIFFTEFKTSIKIFLAVILIHIVSTTVCNLVNENMTELIRFSCFLICAALICYEFKNITEILKNTLTNLNKFMNISIPLYISYMAINGYKSTASSLHCGFAILSMVASQLFNNIVLPILYYCGILSMINGLTRHVNLSSFINSLKKLTKYSLGIILTFISGFMAVSGFSGVARDNLTMRTARYAISNFVPVVGNCLSETLNSITNSSIVLKNSMGYIGFFTIILICIAPVVKIMLTIFMFKFLSSVMHLISTDILTETIESVSEILEIMFGLLLILTVIFILMISLIVSIGA